MTAGEGAACPLTCEMPPATSSSDAASARSDRIIRRIEASIVRVGRAGLLPTSRRHALEPELLHPGGGLRDVDVALGVGRDVMARPEDARGRNRTHDLERLAVDHRDVFLGADVEELLLRIGRQRQIACKACLGSDQLLYELAILREHLDAAVFPIGQVYGPVIGP